MKLCETRKIDELGRIVIPAQLRGLLDVTTGDALDLYYQDDGTILLKRSEANEAKCGLCKTGDKQFTFKDLNFCRECVNKIAKLG